MDTYLAITLAVITFLGAIFTDKDTVISIGKNKRSLRINSRKTLYVLSAASLLLTVIIVIRAQNDKDLEQDVAANTGVLRPEEASAEAIVWNLGGTIFSFNTSNIDFSKIRWETFTPFEGLDLTAKMEDSKLKVSTTIRDSSGNIVCQIVNNEWLVNRPHFALDRNFDDTSFEVKDQLGDIVFQIEISKNTLLMNGKFVKSDGQLMVAFPLRKATQTVPAINGIVNYESGHYKWASQFSFCHFLPIV